MGAGESEQGTSGRVDASGWGIHPTLAAAVTRLSAAGARDEALGRERDARRVVGVPLRASIKPAGRVWRLGVVLLSHECELYVSGGTLRARAEVRRGYTAESSRARAQQSAAARRGGFAEGEVVNIGWRALDPMHPDGRILRLHEGVAQVRWSPHDAGSWVDLAPYLSDRIELLLRPLGES